MNDTSGGARNATARGSGSGRRQTLVPRRVGPLRPAGRRQSRGAAPRRGEEAPGGSGATSDASDPSPPTFPPTGARPNTACPSPPPPTPARPRPRPPSRDRRPIPVRIRRRRRDETQGRPRVSSRARRADDHQRAPSRGDVAPPNEQILALVSGLDRDPEAPPWTGDDLVRWRRDPERCVRRAVAALEDRMRRSLAATVARENARSMSPRGTSAIFSPSVFMRVDKNRHGRLTGDCGVAMFMTAWGRRPDRDEHRHDEHENDPEYDAEIVHDVDDVDESHMNDVGRISTSVGLERRRRRPERRPGVTFSGGEGAKKTRDSRLGARASRPSSASLAAKSLGSPAKPREKDDTFEFVRLLPRDAGMGSTARSTRTSRKPPPPLFSSSTATIATGSCPTRCSFNRSSRPPRVFSGWNL